MENEMNQDQQVAAIKAAAAGFAQELVNRGYNKEAVKQATAMYVGDNGLLLKRAANSEMLRAAVANELQKVRAQMGR